MNTNSPRDFRSFLSNCLLLIAFVTLLASCGGGGGGGEVVVDDPDQEGVGWISLTSPVSGPGYSTDSDTVTLAGGAFISPTWWRCCSGSATDTGVTVTWTNATTGMSGSAYQTLTYICFLSSCSPGTHSWQATIDLAPGENLIAVTATDPSGNLGRARITVTRTPDTTPPTVLSTTPQNGAAGVSTNTALEIRFSELMDSTSINASTILLKDAADNPVSGNVSYAGNVATFKPAANLAESMSYAATVTTGVKDVSGNVLATPYLWTFTTGPAPDLTPPSVSSTSPQDGGTCVPTETTVSASFSKPISASTLNPSTFLLKDALNNPVSGTVSLDDTGAAYFHPDNPLANSTSYTATLTPGVMDLSGNHLASDYLWRFTTRPAGSGTWTPTSNTGAPSPRAGHSAVWTGSRMLIWGGAKPGAYLNSGALYDPATDTWSPMSTAGAPSPRQLATAVSTDTEMIVWGGAGAGDVALGDGARYNPATNTWSAISATGAPSPRTGHTAVWSGSAMIVWGGSAGNTGGIYTPSSNSWSAISLTNAPSARSAHSAVWIGDKMIIWGGREGASPLDSGARFDPSSNSWQPTATLCAPLARYDHIAVWNGTEMLVWGGGQANGPHYSAGGRYNPATDAWQPIPVIGMPGGRIGHTGIWDGNGLIVWGGQDVFATRLNSGGRYHP